MPDNGSVVSISRHISIGESRLNSWSTKKNEWVLESVGTERAGAEATHDDMSGMTRSHLQSHLVGQDRTSLLRKLWFQHLLRPFEF